MRTEVGFVSLGTEAHQREETLVLWRLLPNRSSFSMRPTLSTCGLKSSTLLLGITPRDSNFQVACGRLWHGQMQPGTLQSGCRWLVGDVSAQKAESNGGHTPRGYPGQALPVGPGELSGMCRVTDIWTHSSDLSVQERSHSGDCKTTRTSRSALHSGSKNRPAPQGRDHPCCAKARGGAEPSR